MCIILSLSLYQQDTISIKLCECMLLNILVTQGCKRLYYRARPADFQPPRALKLIGAKKSGGCPSSMIISSTTFMYVVFAENSWILSFKNLNNVEPWAAALIALGIYILVSYIKIYLG